MYNERVYFLENLIESSPYNKTKTVLEREFIAFLSPLPLAQESPVDICRFLVQKDEKGKTQVQYPKCAYGPYR